MRNGADAIYSTAAHAAAVVADAVTTMARLSKAEAAQAAAQTQAAALSILVTTGDVQAKHQPINIVFAVGGSAGGLFTVASPQAAFEAARYQLQLAAVALGGNAVIGCNFGYHTYSTQNLGCSSTGFHVSGYGTVVRFV